MSDDATKDDSTAPPHSTITRRKVLKQSAMAAPVLLVSGVDLGTGPAAGASTAADASMAAGASVPLLSFTPECDDGDAPTPAQTEGPYFTPGSPERTNLVEPGMSGTRLAVVGYVYSRNCVPVANALMDWWQCDSRGNYDNVGYRLRGHYYTNSDGSFRLDTIWPGLYPGRTRHLHVKVQAPNQRILTTQMYFPNEPGNGQDSIYDPRLLMAIRDVSGGKEGRYEFVLSHTADPPPSGRTFQNTQDYPIRDRATVESPIEVTGVSGAAPSALPVTVAIKHTYRGDLRIDLVAPDGGTFRLKDVSGGDSVDDVNQVFTVNAAGKSANGTWKLRVADVYNGDTGVLDSWSIRF